MKSSNVKQSSIDRVNAALDPAAPLLGCAVCGVVSFISQEGSAATIKHVPLNSPAMRILQLSAEEARRFNSTAEEFRPVYSVVSFDGSHQKK